MSKPAARKPTVTVSGYETSLVRCAVAVLLVLAGIAWITVYTQVAMDAANYVKLPGVKKPDTPFPWMSDLGKWNYAIGFGLAFLGLIVAANKKTPLGRGRGVVVPVGAVTRRRWDGRVLHLRPTSLRVPACRPASPGTWPAQLPGLCPVDPGR